MLYSAPATVAARYGFMAPPHARARGRANMAATVAERGCGDKFAHWRCVPVLAFAFALMWSVGASPAKAQSFVPAILGESIEIAVR